MKVLTILGTRPEIIRLSRVIPLLDRHCDHKVVHTGQNYDPKLSDVFFQELGLRAPDHVLSCRGESAFEQIGRILAECERVFKVEKPDRILILGDTNSALSAVVAKRMGIPVFHMEAGNRCYDDRVPEEVNRRIVDHSSDVLLPYTERSKENLLREGIAGNRIYVTGNPIREVLDFYAKPIDASQALETLGLEAGKFFLVTLHRAENVDVPARLDQFIAALHAIAEKYAQPVVCSVHPRTRSQLAKQGRELAGGLVKAIEPLGLFDFVKLEKSARCVLSDSGTVQEECALFNVPNVTLRDVTERPETLDAGSNFIAGADRETILRAVALVLEAAPAWRPPVEYLAETVSSTVARIVLGHLHRSGRADA